jgi:hypothetical protein
MITCSSCYKKFIEKDAKKICSNCFACTGCEIYKCPKCGFEVMVVERKNDFENGNKKD